MHVQGTDSGDSDIQGSELTFTPTTTPPTPTTSAATLILATKATLNGTFTMGSASEIEVWFKYRQTDSGTTWIETSKVSKTSAGSHSVQISYLYQDSEYEFKLIL